MLTDQPATIDLRGQLLFLGTGTSHGVPMIGCDCSTCTSTNPRNKRTRCGVICGLPGGNLLVDTPTDLRAQLLREGVGLVHATVMTHAHADHLHGLDDLRLFPHYTKAPMPIYCEPEVDERIRRVFDYAFTPLATELPAGNLPQLELRPIGPELAPIDVLGAQVTPLRLQHGKLPVLGFRIGSVAYCTDTNGIPEESWLRLAGLDVLILDCLRPKPHPTHFGLDEAVAVAQRVGARRTYLTHISHRLEHEATNALLPAGMEVAYDGLRVPLGI